MPRAVSSERSRSPEMRQQGHPEVKHPVKHLDQYERDFHFMVAQFQSPNTAVWNTDGAGCNRACYYRPGQRHNVLAKLSMLLIDKEAEFKAEFNLPSVPVHKRTHPYTHGRTLNKKETPGLK